MEGGELALPPDAALSTGWGPLAAGAWPSGSATCKIVLADCESRTPASPARAGETSHTVMTSESAPITNTLEYGLVNIAVPSALRTLDVPDFKFLVPLR